MNDFRSKLCTCGNGTHLSSVAHLRQLAQKRIRRANVLLTHAIERRAERLSCMKWFNGSPKWQGKAHGVVESCLCWYHAPRLDGTARLVSKTLFLLCFVLSCLLWRLTVAAYCLIRVLVELVLHT